MKLYLYTNKNIKYNIKRFDTYDYYKIKAICLKERRSIEMINLNRLEINKSKKVDV